jgi:hypothetical protein
VPSVCHTRILPSLTASDPSFCSIKVSDTGIPACIAAHSGESHPLADRSAAAICRAASRAKAKPHVGSPKVRESGMTAPGSPVAVTTQVKVKGMFVCTSPFQLSVRDAAAYSHVAGKVSIASVTDVGNVWVTVAVNTSGASL